MCWSVLEVILTSNIYWEQNDMGWKRATPGPILNTCSDTLNCFFSVLENITSSHKNHRATISVLTRSHLLPSVRQSYCPTFENATSSRVVCQIHLKFIGSQPTHSRHPLLWAQSAVSVRVIMPALLEYRRVCFWFSVWFSSLKVNWADSLKVITLSTPELNPAIARH